MRERLTATLLRGERAAYEIVGALQRRRPRADGLRNHDLAGLNPAIPRGQLVAVTRSDESVGGRQRLALLHLMDAPLTVRKEPCAIFVPVPQEGSTYRHNGLHSESGELIEDSCLFRDTDRSEQMSVAVPFDRTAVDVDEREVIYGGPLVTHYGHLLTESAARLWYASRHDDLPILVHGIGALSRAHVAAFVRGLGLAETRFIGPARPTQFREVHIPEPSIVDRFAIHPAHIELTRACAARVLADTTLRPSTRPLYLARTKLDVRDRSTYGEPALVRELLRRGVRVVHPQQLTFEEQVRMVNEHETIIGPLGSAHHSTALALTPRHDINICHWPADTYVLIDLAAGNRAHYLQLTHAVRSMQSKPNHLVDVPLTLRALDQLGVFA